MKYKINDKLSHPDYNCTQIVIDVLKSNINGKEYYLLKNSYETYIEFIISTDEIDNNTEWQSVNNYRFNIGDALTSKFYNATVKGYCMRNGKPCYNLRIIGVYSYDDVLTQEETEAKFSKCR